MDPARHQPAPLQRTNWKDAPRASQADLDAAGPVIETWQAVWIRKAGWHPGILTGWRQIGRGDWAARVQWGPAPDETGWLTYKAVAIRPIVAPVDGADPDGGTR